MTAVDVFVPITKAVHAPQDKQISDVLVPMIQAEIVHAPQDEKLNENAADGGIHCLGYVSEKRGTQAHASVNVGSNT